MRKPLLLLLSAIVLVMSCSKDYKRLPSPGRMIKQFALAEGQIGPAVFDNTTHTITVTVQKGVNMAALTANMVVSDGSKVSPASGATFNATSLNQLFVVTAESGDKNDWNVVFKVYDFYSSDYGVFAITNTSGKMLQVAGDYTFNEKYKDNQKIEAGTSVAAMPVWQKWHLIYNSADGDVRYYQIRNLYTGKFLNAGTGAQAGAQPEQYRESATAGELWIVKQSSTLGIFSIVNKNTGLAVSVSAEDGKVTLENVDDKSSNQRFTFKPLPEQAYRDDSAIGFFERNNSSQGSVAFDQGTSVPLSDGRVLWITQDAWDGSRLRDNHKFSCSDYFNYNNSVMIQPKATDWNPEHTTNMTIPNSAHGRPRQIFNNQPGTDWSWPGLGVQIGNNVWVQCGEGKGLGGTNQSLYKLTPNAGDEWTAVRYTPAGMSGQVNISYSVGMVKGNDGYVYSFGSQGFNFGYGNNIFVARFAESDPLTWTFWDGASWVNTPTTNDAAKVAVGPGNNSISYLNGKYIMMSMDQGFNCEDKRDIYISTSSSPTGPFTAQKYIYTVSEYFGGKYARYYTPSIHPESVNGRNELLLTFCLNFSGCGVSDCQDGYLDPYYYRVKNIRVPYSVVGL
ncbi:MAG: RICIN domain-containing protein [Bacteroidota bacterium]